MADKGRRLDYGETSYGTPDRVALGCGVLFALVSFVLVAVFFGLWLHRWSTWDTKLASIEAKVIAALDGGGGGEAADKLRSIVRGGSAFIQDLGRMDASRFEIELLQSQQPDLSWRASRMYKWPDMLKALQRAIDGLGPFQFWQGDGNPTYAMVNLAAFLSQCMEETIRYDACDENNWSQGDNSGLDAATGVATEYPISAACGQGAHQSYQDYTCSTPEFACPVDPNMILRARTSARWWGAPPPLFCAPRRLTGATGNWEKQMPLNCQWDVWHNESPRGMFVGQNVTEAYIRYLRGQETDGTLPRTCRDYGTPGGTWTDGTWQQKAGRAQMERPIKNLVGRDDVEGCCWWGRGVIQTTGPCNIGLFNAELGKGALARGRQPPFPDVDFCANPEAICSDDRYPELKWISGFFYWLTSVQTYNQRGWEYKQQLKQWVDSGMPSIGRDASFLRSVSGIVNRGCHDPGVSCGTVTPGESGPHRAQNFCLALRALQVIPSNSDCGGQRT